MKRRTLLTATGAILAAGAGWLVLQPGPNGEASNLLAGIANAQDGTGDPDSIPDMVLGAEDAPIEVIEYASYTCPHCASFHSDQFKQLKANYIDTGKVRFIYREVYFDRFGLWASMIARCGGESRFFGITDLIYQKQRDWTASGDPAVIVDELRKIAKTAGLNEAALDACMSDGEMAESLVGWFQTNAERDGITSTPSFLINGEKYSNMAYPDFAAILDEKLAG
ncbi:Protein-disulfide isomerase [Cognatiyoonia koreensis]|uniref:Protein-disulfide isomerase n=1 Tax=Cognatiyoonia koreensis TaxID=364200 RepID=A0A1I0RU96_9RHOB|nr:DsbA family protein [Cognatiyoonia koreensis]SEW44933.1 Protein-disulfide isomerase [Cognatiyoonia koreensis]